MLISNCSYPCYVGLSMFFSPKMEIDASSSMDQLSIVNDDSSISLSLDPVETRSAKKARQEQGLFLGENPPITSDREQRILNGMNLVKFKGLSLLYHLL